MDELKTISIDITHSVFDNDIKATMYLIKDIYGDSFIVSIPVITFSFNLREGYKEIDYDRMERRLPLKEPVIKIDKLIQAIKEGIEEF